MSMNRFGRFSSIVLCLLCVLLPGTTIAGFITATPSNYTGYLAGLQPGDTLFLSTGNYTHNLTLNNLNGTAANPIVITGAGNSTVIQGQSCCNTVSITKCSYIVVRNMKLDGQNEFVDALKAEGTSGNWAHHITVEYLNIVNYGVDQQAVGINTKCSAWNWLIRKNRIIGAGTGIYLGNSDGTRPFVNGIIEYNFIANTVGYNMEIKHQLSGERDAFPGTAVDGKTIIRYNVFTKQENASTGSNARPNLLVGGFPATGWGSSDYYEIYGNFFYENPVEALFQGTGNIMLYDNIFVNHEDPSGLRAVYITPQNGISPQDIRVFHNTMWANNASGGIRVYSPNPSYQQLCFANAVFAPSPITNFGGAQDNITGDYTQASAYFLSANQNLSSLDLYPKNGQLTGNSTTSTPFEALDDWNKDFNGAVYDWTYRGAYSACCMNPGWKLQLDTIPERHQIASDILTPDTANFNVFPNPSSGIATISCPPDASLLRILDLNGKEVWGKEQPHGILEFRTENQGLYLIQVVVNKAVATKKLLILAR